MWAADEQHNVVKKKDQMEEEQQKSNHKQAHLKLTGKGRFLDASKQSDFKYIAFGGAEHAARMKSLQELYGLDFIPYLTSVQANIYHGCKLLTPWCQAETKKVLGREGDGGQVPFAVHPKIYQHLQFPGIKISQLP